MDLNDPIVIALIKLYAKHDGFFCDFYNGRFRLITNWLTEDWTGYDAYKDIVRFREDNTVPWYAKSQALIQMAGILRVYPGDLYRKIKELERE